LVGGLVCLTDKEGLKKKDHDQKQAGIEKKGEILERMATMGNLHCGREEGPSSCGVPDILFRQGEGEKKEEGGGENVFSTPRSEKSQRKGADKGGPYCLEGEDYIFPPRDKLDKGTAG